MPALPWLRGSAASAPDPDSELVVMASRLPLIHYRHTGLHPVDPAGPRPAGRGARPRRLLARRQGVPQDVLDALRLDRSGGHGGVRPPGPAPVGHGCDPSAHGPAELHLLDSRLRRPTPQVVRGAPAHGGRPKDRGDSAGSDRSRSEEVPVSAASRKGRDTVTVVPSPSVESTASSRRGPRRCS